MTENPSQLPPQDIDDPQLNKHIVHAARTLIDDKTGKELPIVEPPETILTDRLRDMVTANAEAAVKSFHADQQKDKYIDKLEKDARHDRQTGLLTKEVLKDDIRRSVEQAKRENPPAGIGLVKIDGKGLKLVNDNISDEAGDKLINTVAEACQENIRGSDGAYRGGKRSDEFFVLFSLMHGSEDEGTQLLEERTQAIEQTFEQKASEDPDLNKALEENWIGLYAGHAYIDLNNPEFRNKSPDEIARLLFRKADEAFGIQKRNAKAEAIQRWYEKTGQKRPPVDHRLL